jgi:probable phosphoglycerate mutase
MPQPLITANRTTARICLVRHGETDWNAERRLQGHQDIPLNATGMAQAEALADALAVTPIAVIYSSDLIRALNTARQVGKRLGMPVEQLSAARERNFGIFQGLTRQEAEHRYPEMQIRVSRRDPDFVPPEGESLLQCYARIAALLDWLADRHAGQTILLVTHGGVLDAARRFATGMALDLPRDFELGNAALNWLSRTDGVWTIDDWNDQHHLGGSLDELEV